MKLFNSIIRTFAIAPFTMICGVKAASYAMHWALWCPNNDLGFAIVLSLYIFAITMMAFAIYLLSPVFWTALFGTAVSEITGSSMDRRETRKNVKKLESRGRMKLIIFHIKEIVSE